VLLLRQERGHQRRATVASRLDDKELCWLLLSDSADAEVRLSGGPLSRSSRRGLLAGRRCRAAAGRRRGVWFRPSPAGLPPVRCDFGRLCVPPAGAWTDEVEVHDPVAHPGDAAEEDSPSEVHLDDVVSPDAPCPYRLSPQVIEKCGAVGRPGRRPPRECAGGCSSSRPVCSVIAASWLRRAGRAGRRAVVAPPRAQPAAGP